MDIKPEFHDMQVFITSQEYSAKLRSLVGIVFVESISRSPLVLLAVVPNDNRHHSVQDLLPSARSYAIQYPKSVFT